MKKILISTILIFSMLSCKENTNHIYEEHAQIQVPLITKTYICDFPYANNIDEINVVTIADCEYLVSNATSQSDITMTHKGDCKFCTQRQEELIRKIISEKFQ